ncbi:MAG: 23S rRNA (pseudouridine(1915)-N(3))-methyltransferase RlmH [Candidatus Marsarchaeota archaeon]|nr:23S rRNA (pseudouridine(1915)-N(3))-methyltransferase RlmH [Candidatus Marsarchaeota archaeon]
MPRKIRLVAVGRVKEEYLRAGMAEYEKRLRPYCSLEVVELKDEGMEKEAERMEKYLGPNTFLLDEAGTSLDSSAFAKLFSADPAAPLTFIIGGPYGISPQLKKRCKCVSLSKMTFTHEMCRLFFLEQLYRAVLANSGRAYQK